MDNQNFNFWSLSQKPSSLICYGRSLVATFCVPCLDLRADKIIHSYSISHGQQSSQLTGIKSTKGFVKCNHLLLVLCICVNYQQDTLKGRTIINEKEKHFQRAFTATVTVQQSIIKRGNIQCYDILTKY